MDKNNVANSFGRIWTINLYICCYFFYYHCELQPPTFSKQFLECYFCKYFQCIKWRNVKGTFLILNISDKIFEFYVNFKFLLCVLEISLWEKTDMYDINEYDCRSMMKTNKKVHKINLNKTEIHWDSYL